MHLELHLPLPPNLTSSARILLSPRNRLKLAQSSPYPRLKDWLPTHHGALVLDSPSASLVACHSGQGRKKHRRRDPHRKPQRRLNLSIL